MGCASSYSYDTWDDARRVAEVERLFRGRYEPMLNLGASTPVQSITAVEVKQLLAQDQNVVLVDVRSAAERKISFINGAIPAEEYTPGPVDRDVCVVAYCTVGLRSGLWVRARQGAAGSPRMLNLAGGILSWTHAGGLLYTESNTGMDNSEVVRTSHVSVAPLNVSADVEPQLEPLHVPTRNIHVYGAKWNLAPRSYHAVLR